MLSEQLGSISKVHFKHQSSRNAHLQGIYHSADIGGGSVIFPIMERDHPWKGFSKTYLLKDAKFPSGIQVFDSCRLLVSK